jgi:hypothetical protein
LAHALIGHTPGIENPAAGSPATSLTAQVEGVIEIVDAVKSQYNKVIIAGHSVGSWLTLQVSCSFTFACCVRPTRLLFQALKA